METVMDIVGGIAGMGANVASGGLFGLVGSLVGVGTKYLQRRQEMAEKELERAHELKLLDAQRLARAEETEGELAVADSKGSWEGLQASFATTIPASEVPRWVNGLRSMFRPFLTIALVVVVYLIFRDLLAAITGATGADGSTLAVIFTEAEAKVALIYIIHSITFAAVTAIVWWFGDRAMAPPGAKNR